MKSDKHDQRDGERTTKTHLPIYGVGPLYGFTVGITAVGGMILAALDWLESGELHHVAAVIASMVVGIALCVAGVCVWIPAALGKTCIDRYIKENQLCVTGIYAWVRNPCYTGITLFFVGGLIMAHNLWLWILPPVYWLFLTLLMKGTEEKWLRRRYGAPYEAYCRKVNRCIPWFPKK